MCWVVKQCRRAVPSMVFLTCHVPKYICSENDLRAMRLVHDRVVDTSVLFRGNNGRKFCEFMRLAATLFYPARFSPVYSIETSHCFVAEAHYPS